MALRRVLASRREQARLPPILPNSRPAPSKPRVWQPPLPETPKRTRRTSSVPAAAAPAPPEAPPEALRPHSDRAPQRHRAEVAPRLARTPPWREPQEPKPPLGHLPGWIGQMRSSVEATRQLVKGEEKTLSAAKLEPLGDCSPLKRQEPRCATNAHASTEGSSRSEALAWPPEPKERKQQTIPEMGLAFAEPISSLQSPKAELHFSYLFMDFTRFESATFFTFVSFSGNLLSLPLDFIGEQLPNFTSGFYRSLHLSKRIPN
eukprot:g15623.t1